MLDVLRYGIGGFCIIKIISEEKFRNRALVPQLLIYVLPYIIVALSHPMASWVFVNIGSDNDLQSDDTKPLPEPMFINYTPRNTWFLWNSNQNLRKVNLWKRIWKCYL